MKAQFWFIFFLSSLAFADDPPPTEDWDNSAHAVATEHGQAALAVNAENWQHVQSAHFVLHSANKSVALRTAQEAEFYLGKIFEGLEIKELESKRKAHVFIFERKEDWEEFAKAATLDPWTGGFFDGLDLFYRRRMGQNILHSDSTLPHEIAHCALKFKFPIAAIPLALNEGFAEHVSRRLAFQYLRPRGYDVRVASNRVPRESFLPAEELLAATRYPQDEKALRAFYDESERLVNFLVARRGFPKFLEWLEAIADGQDAVTALPKIYDGDFASFDLFAAAFAETAVEEAP